MTRATNLRVAAVVAAALAACLLALVLGTGREAQALGPNAVRAGFNDNVLPRNDDNSTSQVPLGFSGPLNFFGNNYTNVYVNNNGNVTFDQALSTFTPFDLTSTGRVIIAPFFGDVDTRASSTSPVTYSYGQSSVDGRDAFGVNWVDVGYFDRRADKLNNFQLVLIDRSDVGTGDFDIEFNYDRIQWETGDASGGRNGLGGNSARAGFSNGTRASGTSFELPGSAVNGALLDSNAQMGLIHNSRNSAQPGRYVFQVRNGVVDIPANEPPTADAGGPYEVDEGGSVDLAASGNDPENGTLTYEWDLDGDGSFETQGQNAVFSAANLDGPDSRTVAVRVTDAEGASATDEAVVNVNNADPAATFGSTSPVDEGGAFELSLTEPSDAGAADTTAGFTYAFDCGDGYGPFGPDNTADCPTDDDGTRAVGGKVRDKDGGITGYTGSVDVNNVAPTITDLSAPTQALVNKPVSITGTATDPSSVDTAAGFSWSWAVDGGAYAPGPNPFDTSFSACGDHTVSARAEDKDGGVSGPATSGVVSAYEAHFRPPLDEGVYNTVQAGRVVPVKISIGCGDALTGLRPAIQLLKGDKSGGNETSSDAVETMSSSAADTTGVMRPADGGYIYNLKVPGSAAPGDLLTARVRPFGDGNPGAGMYVVLKIRR